MDSKIAQHLNSVNELSGLVCARTSCSLPEENNPTLFRGLPLVLLDAVRHHNRDLMNACIEALRSSPHIIEQKFHKHLHAALWVAQHTDSPLEESLSLLSQNYYAPLAAQYVLNVESQRWNLNNFHKAVEQIVSNHSWKNMRIPLEALEYLGARDAVEEFVHLSELFEVRTHPSVWDKVGVFALCYNAKNVGDYILNTPYNEQAWSLWMLGCSSPSDIVARVPPDARVNFLIAVLERVNAPNPHHHKPLVDALSKDFIALSAEDKVKALNYLSNTEHPLTHQLKSDLENELQKERLLKHIGPHNRSVSKSKM